MASQAPASDGRRKAAAARRREREAQIIAATRELFDSKGVRDAQIEEIASAVGINRAIVYRHFTGKEELFSLTLVGYLEELKEAMVAAAAPETTHTGRLAAIVGAFVDFGVTHPAFVDCAQSLMTRPAGELFDDLSESALLRLGRGMTSCLTIFADELRDGAAAKAFSLTEDPVLLANTLYASGLGALHLARLGVLVSEVAPGIPTVNRVTADQVRSYMVTSALALVSPNRATA
ncbi:TetR/AcrR family transcriptional regulator [Nocardioides sp. CPCC 206347]|uniref:TetR/AcrR family transcriptional regulator n=1 Tax=unclassified Nocardioides TaxID=2615069 RepID=UPI00360A1BB3